SQGPDWRWKVRDVAMFEVQQNSTRGWLSLAAALTLLAAILVSPVFADQKNKKPAAPAPEPPAVPTVDISNIVWPQPPAIPRIKYLDYFSAEKPEPVAAEAPKQK